MGDETCTKEQWENYLKEEAVKERRELFQKVAIAILNNDVGKTIEYDGSWLRIAMDKTEAILTASQKFAEQQPRKSEGESE